MIDPTEFAKVMAFIAATIQKPVTKDTVEAYYSLLSDLTLESLQAGAKRVLLEHPWATFPSVAELRAAAVQAMKGEVVALTAGQAFELAWKAVSRIDLEIAHTIEPAMAALPPLVSRAMNAYGLASLVYGKEPLTIVRAQFERIFNDLAEADSRRALLPTSLVQQIEQQGKSALSGPAAEAVQKIGREDK